MKTVQRFTAEYLAVTRDATPEQVLHFLEEFRQLQAPAVRSKPTNLRVPEPLHAAFKRRSALEKVAYQSRIKELIRAWLEGTSS